MNVRHDKLLDIFNCIENPTDTRFIQLKYAEGGDAHLGFTGLLKEMRPSTEKTTRKTKSEWKQPLVQNKKNVSFLLRLLEI